MDSDQPVHHAQRWVLLTGWIGSLVVHAGLVIGMTCIVFEYSKDEVGSLSGVMSQPTNDDVAELILESPEMIESGGADGPSEIENLVERLSDSNTRRAMQNTLSGVGDGTSTGEGSGDDGGIALPAINVPSYAVTKGSFSAWTIPEDPEPGKSYLIRIVVQVPEEGKKSSKFHLRDISGMVIGTDGWKQVIRFKAGQTAQLKDGSVQMDILVPGARKLVRDTIRIESKLLKEKQVIELVF